MMIGRHDKSVLTIMWLYIAIFARIPCGIRLYSKQNYHAWVAWNMLLPYPHTDLLPSRLYISKNIYRIWKCNLNDTIKCFSVTYFS